MDTNPDIAQSKECPVCCCSEDDLLDPNKDKNFYWKTEPERPFQSTVFHIVSFYDCTECLIKLLKNINYVIPLLKSNCEGHNALSVLVGRASLNCLEIIAPYLKIKNIFPLNKQSLLTQAIAINSPKTLQILLDRFLICIFQDTFPENFDVKFREMFAFCVNHKLYQSFKVLLGALANKEFRDEIGNQIRFTFPLSEIANNYDFIKIYIKKTQKFKDLTTIWRIKIDNGENGIRQLDSHSLLNEPAFEILNNEMKNYLLQNLSLSITKPAVKVQKVRS